MKLADESESSEYSQTVLTIWLKPTQGARREVTWEYVTLQPARGQPVTYHQTYGQIHMP